MIHTFQIQCTFTTVTLLLKCRIFSHHFLNVFDDKSPIMKFKSIIWQVASYITEASLSLGSLLFLITPSLQVPTYYITSWLSECSPFVCYQKHWRACFCVLHPTILSSLHPCFPPHHSFVFYTHSEWCCSNTTQMASFHLHLLLPS